MWLICLWVCCGIGGFTLFVVGSVDMGMGGTLTGVGSLGIVVFIWVGCGLFELQLVYFCLNYPLYSITTEGFDIIGGCCGSCFLLSLFSLECVLLPILTFTIWCCSWCCSILGLPLFFFSFIGFLFFAYCVILLFVPLLYIHDKHFTPIYLHHYHCILKLNMDIIFQYLQQFSQNLFHLLIYYGNFYQ